MTFGGLMMEGLRTLYEYVAEHTLFCLIPAFFIAGAITAFLNTAAVMRYFGPKTNKVLAYSVASVSGAILAVCSCTVLPLFTGIREKGAGLGPAVAFLYSSPAINILAMTYSIHLLGYGLGVARIVGAVGFAFVIGLIMAGIFHREEERRVLDAEAAEAFAYDDGSRTRPGLQDLAYFGVLIAILLYGTAKMPTIIKYAGEVLLVALLIYLVKRWFTREEIKTWFSETWRMVKLILPVLLIGVFLVGVVKELIPSDVIARYVGGNTIGGNAIASVSGAFMYFATLTEVPIVRGLLDLGMGKGPALALMLAGPALSLPSMIVLIRVMGFRKAGTYILLVCLFAMGTGYVFGMFAG
ncbi:MAG: permease [Actinobacteria bacterium]|nr:permease [Actinomycetota bacterium]